MLRAAALRRGLSTSQGKRVVVVDGARIPFAMAGTKYKDQMAVDLMRYALRGLLTKTALPAHEVDYVLCGTVVQEPRTSNIAREAAMHAGLPHDIPAHTVSLACVSANAAICQGAEKILAGASSASRGAVTSSIRLVSIRSDRNAPRRPGGRRHRGRL